MAVNAAAVAATLKYSIFVVETISWLVQKKIALPKPQKPNKFIHI